MSLFFCASSSAQLSSWRNTVMSSFSVLCRHKQRGTQQILSQAPLKSSQLCQRQRQLQLRAIQRPGPRLPAATVQAATAWLQQPSQQR